MIMLGAAALVCLVDWGGEAVFKDLKIIDGMLWAIIASGKRCGCAVCNLYRTGRSLCCHFECRTMMVILTIGLSKPVSAVLNKKN